LVNALVVDGVDDRLAVPVAIGVSVGASPSGSGATMMRDISLAADRRAVRIAGPANSLRFVISPHAMS
jgi:hypothetical protein